MVVTVSVIAASLLLAIVFFLVPWIRDGKNAGGSTGSSYPYGSGWLKQIGPAQATFMVSDADGNSIADYWVDDIAGLYLFIPKGTGSSVRKPIWLIDESIALADGRTAGLYRKSDGSAIVFSPKDGYWVMSLRGFETADGNVEPYHTHRASQFGFGAFPDRYGESGRLVYISNQEGVLYSKDPGSDDAIWKVKPEAGAGSTRGKLRDAYSVFPHKPEKVGWRKPE